MKHVKILKPDIGRWKVNQIVGVPDDTAKRLCAERLAELTEAPISVVEPVAMTLEEAMSGKESVTVK